MLPHQQRVIDERDELEVKRLALEKFINESPIFENLTISDRELMCEQYRSMCVYSATLAERIRRF